MEMDMLSRMQFILAFSSRNGLDPFSPVFKPLWEGLPPRQSDGTGGLPQHSDEMKSEVSHSPPPADRDGSSTTKDRLELGHV